MDFKQAETKFKQLKAQFDAGALTENAFKARLEELMIRDERGDWWMIGYETERWYRNNGTDWVQADPPGSLVQEPIRTSTSNWSATFWVTLGWVIGGAIGGWIYWAMDDSLGLLGGTTAGVIGGLVTAIILYFKQTRSHLNKIIWITLGWALGGAIGWPIGEALTEASGAAVGGAIGGIIGWGITSRFLPGISNWKSALWITLAWTISAAIGWTIAREIQFNVDGAIGWPVGRAISGAIGGFVAIWQIRKG
jgi:hypothetical protein